MGFFGGLVKDDRARSGAVDKILFVSVENAGRSQMAEAFVNTYGKGIMESVSAGINPAKEVDPVVIQVMREVGIDLSASKPKPIANQMFHEADSIFVFGCNVKGFCSNSQLKKITNLEIEDPRGKSTDRVREIRNEIEKRMRYLLNETTRVQTAMVWIKKASSLADSGKDKKAIECYDIALSTLPDNPLIWYNKANSYYRLRSLREAVDCYSKALGLDTRHASSWYGKGICLGDLGQNETALECFDKALGIDPKNAMYLAGKAVSLTALHRTAEAKRHFDEALKIDPNNKKVKAAMDLLRMQGQPSK